MKLDVYRIKRNLRPFIKKRIDFSVVDLDRFIFNDFIPYNLYVEVRYRYHDTEKINSFIEEFKKSFYDYGSKHNLSTHFKGFTTKTNWNRGYVCFVNEKHQSLMDELQTQLNETIEELTDYHLEDEIDGFGGKITYRTFGFGGREFSYEEGPFILLEFEDYYNYEILKKINFHFLKNISSILPDLKLELRSTINNSIKYKVSVFPES